MYLHPWAFIGAFAIGILYVYLYHPPPKVVIKFPNPENADQITYEDAAENCFRISAKKVSCEGHDKGVVVPQPLFT